MAQRTRHYNRNMGPKTWKKWTDWPLMVLSVVFLVVYSWEILSRTHIALSVPAILVAVMFSVLIGLIFGLVPAVKASKLNPIEALRRE